MATECILRAVQIEFPGTARIPRGSCSGNLGGEEEVASTQEEHEGTREVPKPSRAVRRRSTEAAPEGLEFLGWFGGLRAGWWHQEGAGVGCCLAQGVQGRLWELCWCQGTWGDVCDGSPQTEMVFFGCVCLHTFPWSLGSCVTQSLGCCSSRCKVRIFVCKGRILKFWS